MSAALDLAADRPAGALLIHGDLGILRRGQQLMWVLESRDHAAFRDGRRAGADAGIRDLEEALP